MHRAPTALGPRKRKHSVSWQTTAPIAMTSTRTPSPTNSSLPRRYTRKVHHVFWTNETSKTISKLCSSGNTFEFRYALNYCSEFKIKCECCLSTTEWMYLILLVFNLYYLYLMSFVSKFIFPMEILQVSNFVSTVTEFVFDGTVTPVCKLVRCSWNCCKDILLCIILFDSRIKKVLIFQCFIYHIRTYCGSIEWKVSLLK